LHLLSVQHTVMIEKLNFKLVLLGQLQSDPIESRFGWLRQLSAANYYISVKQVLDSERKIRALSLLKYSRFSLSENDAAIDEQVDDLASQRSFQEVAADLFGDTVNCNITPSANDTNVMYYVSGYIARSIMRTTKCDDCTEVLREPNIEPLVFDESMDYRSSEFFDAVNRGGLSRPTELTFLLVIHCSQV